MCAEEWVVSRSRVRPVESVTSTLPSEYRLPADVRKRTCTPGKGRPPRFCSADEDLRLAARGGRRDGSAQAATMTSSGALSTGSGGGGESWAAGSPGGAPPDGAPPAGPRRIALHPAAGQTRAAARRRVVIPGP